MPVFWVVVKDGIPAQCQTRGTLGGTIKLCRVAEHERGCTKHGGATRQSSEPRVIGKNGITISTIWFFCFQLQDHVKSMGKRKKKKVMNALSCPCMWAWTARGTDAFSAVYLTRETVKSTNTKWKRSLLSCCRSQLTPRRSHAHYPTNLTPLTRPHPLKAFFFFYYSGDRCSLTCFVRVYFFSSYFQLVFNQAVARVTELK